MKQPNKYEQFLNNLHRENLQGYNEMQAMRYRIAARLGLNEGDALELAAGIVAGPRIKQQESERMNGQKVKLSQPKRGAMSKAEADKILDASIRSAMQKYNVSYTDAFWKLQSEQPGLLLGWQAVTKRSNEK